MKRRHDKKGNRQRKLITLLDPRSPISEAYRTLRTNIQFSSVDHQLRLLMFTSSGPGEGKTTTTCNTAIVAAQAGKKVLIIDADLRKPTVHYTFRVPNTVGLTSVLASQRSLDEAIQTTEVPGLDILTSGPIPPNPAELLGSKAMSNIIEQLKERYDQIIFDSPPVLAVADAQILSTYMDGVILVIHAGNTSRDLVIRAKQQLDTVQARVIGVVLNNKKLEHEHEYYYYYSSDK